MCFLVLMLFDLLTQTPLPFPSPAPLLQVATHQRCFIQVVTTPAVLFYFFVVFVFFPHFRETWLRVHLRGLVRRRRGVKRRPAARLPLLC